MAKLKVYDMQANEVGSINLKDEIFNVEYNEPVIHQVIVAENANARQGTKASLSRSEVRGHAKKPYAQKHTGNARHGDTKAPQFKGGAKVFPARPRDFSKKVNKQVKYLAFLSALSQKLRQNEITVVDEIKVAEAKTKNVSAFLKAFGFNRSTVIVTAEKDEALLKAAANIPFAKVTTATLLNVGEIVANKNIIFSKNAIEKLEEARV